MIKVMEQSLANLIAAGEVVERPLSILKELLENSIDANANEIKITLKSSGMELISVEDNGIGMSRSDVEKCILRHASSKLYTADDLNAISTLGFRGEALASICAVSKVTINSYDGNESTSMHVLAGVIESISSASAKAGTTVLVESLFYNTPARLKYIVNLHTELNKIIDFITKVCLSHPEISFQLINDDNKIIHTSKSSNVLKVISEVYGVETAKLMDEVSANNSNYSVSAYISKTQMQRASKKYVSVYVNGRVIYNEELIRAIVNVYRLYIPKSRYPFVVLYITCDPSLIDVNIHPHKTEIKFSLYDTLKLLIEEMISTKLSSYSHEVKIFSPYDNKVTFSQLDLVRDEKPLQEEIKPIYNDLKIDDKPLYVHEDIKETVIEHKEIKNKRFYEIVGQLKGTYILASDDEKMFIVDQHAAQERINYEKLRKVFSEKSLHIHELLVPITIEYPRNEFDLIIKHLDILKEIGIEIESFGYNVIRINSLANWIEKDFEEEVVSYILDQIINEEKIDLLHCLDDIIELISCRSSIKANHKLSILEMETLLDELFTCDDPYHCPHKRPTIITYDYKEIEKMFMRIM